MNDVVTTFPLLRLPNHAILNTIRVMSPPRIFGISLLSKKTKNLVESLKIKTLCFAVYVTAHFKVTLYFSYQKQLQFQLYHVRENEPLQELETPGEVRILYKRKRITWTNSRSVKQLRDHLSFIFHSSTTLLSFEENCERFSLESVHKNFGDFRSIQFSSGSHEHNRRIFNLFQPASIFLVDRALIDTCVPRDVLIRISDIINVTNVRITSNELLMTNSRAIYFGCRELSVKIINQFLKLWIKGCNPRLEGLFLWLLPNFRTEELMKGLKYKDAPVNRGRFFKTAGVQAFIRVTEGWDISRYDGTKATITVSSNVFASFQLFVWHDHCLVSEFDL